MSERKFVIIRIVKKMGTGEEGSIPSKNEGFEL